jgi:hypothetical protein
LRIAGTSWWALNESRASLPTLGQQLHMESDT